MNSEGVMTAQEMIADDTGRLIRLSRLNVDPELGEAADAIKILKSRIAAALEALDSAKPDSATGAAARIGRARKALRGET